ncbi:uncharacterized protein LOC144132689 [Amblyomma americanum]
MKRTYIALSFLLVAFLDTAFSAGHKCSTINCPRPFKLACLVEVNRCECKCVRSENACEYLQSHPCPQGLSLICSGNAQHCTCQCGRYRNQLGEATSGHSPFLLLLSLRQS